MPEPNISVQGTPNPNAAKFTVDRTLIEGGAGISFFDAETASEDALASRLFAIGGVESIFIAAESTDEDFAGPGFAGCHNCAESLHTHSLDQNRISNFNFPKQANPLNAVCNNPCDERCGLKGYALINGKHHRTRRNIHVLAVGAP